jgi:hypothetical protein
MKRGFEAKTSLTPEEKIKAAYLHEIMGVDQHILAAAYGVNPGRVAEAIKTVRSAIGMNIEEGSNQ